MSSGRTSGAPPPSPSVAIDPARLQTVLDESCAALLALEQAQREIGDAPALQEIRRAESQAIDVIREAIADLRRFNLSDAVSPLVLGFVRATAD